MFLVFALLSITDLKIGELADNDAFEEFDDNELDTDLSENCTEPILIASYGTPDAMTAEEAKALIDVCIKNHNVKEFTINAKADFTITNGTDIKYTISGSSFKLLIEEAPSYLTLVDCTDMTLEAKKESIKLEATVKNIKGSSSIEANFKKLQIDVTEPKSIADCFSESLVEETLIITNSSNIIEEDDIHFSVPITNNTIVKVDSKDLIVYTNGISYCNRTIEFQANEIYEFPAKIVPYNFHNVLKIKLSQDEVQRKSLSSEEDMNKIVEVQSIPTNCHVSLGKQGTTELENYNVVLESADGRFNFDSTVRTNVSLGSRIQTVVSPTTLDNIIGYQSQTNGEYLLGTGIVGQEVDTITFVEGGIKVGGTVYSNIKVLNQNGNNRKLEIKYEGGNNNIKIIAEDNTNFYFDESCSNSQAKFNIIANANQKLNFSSADGVDLENVVEIKDNSGQTIPITTYTGNDDTGDNGDDNSKTTIIVISVVAAVLVVTIVVVLILCFCSNKKNTHQSSTGSMESQSNPKLKNRPDPSKRGQNKSLRMSNYRKNNNSSSSSSSTESSSTNSDSESSSSDRKRKNRRNKTKYAH